MPERMVTIFEGPDKGTRLTLGDKPIRLGRDGACDVVLHDDRASRVHTRLVPHGEGVTIVDENSSNGTFVNGGLVSECRLHAGDVITIGAQKLIYESGEDAGRPRPRRPLGVPEPAAPGMATEVLPDTPAAPRTQGLPFDPGDVLQAVAEAARPVAEPLGIHITVETETSEIPTDTLNLDRQKVYRELAMLLSSFLNVLPSGEGTVALRFRPDPARDGVQFEIICVGLAIPRQGIIALATEGAFVDVQKTAQENKGHLEILPADSADILARLSLPGTLSDGSRPTIIK